MVHLDHVTQTALIFQYTIQVCFHIKRFFPREKNRGYSIKFYTWRLHPEVQPLSLYTRTIFDRKDPPFIYLIMTNGTPFTDQFLQLCIPFNFCSGTVF